MKDYIDKHKGERKTADQIKEAMRKTVKKKKLGRTS